jgi:HD-GYP domain-containing protein (c-di-GMP phosphodiesterase class II)
MAQGSANRAPLISQSGSELVLKLYNTIRSLTVAQHDISVLCEILEDQVEKEGELCLQIGKDRFLLNDKKVEMRSGHAVHQILLSEFKKRKISKIEFLKVPDPRDLEEFLRSLMGMNDTGPNRGEMVQKILEQKHIESVRVEGLGAEGRDQDWIVSHERNARYTRLYAYAIQLIRGMLIRASKGKSLDLSLPMRVIRTMVSGYGDSPATFMGLATMKTSREFLANHSVNVTIYAIALGYRLGFPNRLLVDLGLAALFHDIGESRFTWSGGTGDQNLTEEQGEEVRRHPTLGAKIMLASVGSDRRTLGRLIPGIFEHHLRYDFSGFPDVKQKRSISLVGRIISLADFYDLAARPYGKNRFPCFSDRLLRVILDRSGRDFDPVLARYFVRALGLFPVGTLCRLSTGELGVVCSAMEEGTTGDRPWVRILVPAGERYRRGDMVNLESLDETTGRYRRIIAEVLDPNDLGIDVADYLIEFSS